MATSSNKGKVRRFGGIAGRLAELDKLGLGAMTHPETKRWIARTILFAHMKRMMAQQLRNLRDTCLPQYRALHELGCTMPIARFSSFPVLVIEEVTVTATGRTQTQRSHSVDSWSSLRQAADHFREARELSNSIKEWTSALNMNRGWFNNAVLMNLCGWRMDTKAEQELSWVFPGAMSLEPTSRTGIDIQRLHGSGTLDRAIPVPAVRPYNPSTQTRMEHQSELKAELISYYAKQEALFSRAGFQKTTQKRARTEEDPWLHFKWFVKYQMQNQPGSEIVKKYHLGTGEGTVYRALRELATVLQVTLRPQVKKPSRKVNKKNLNS
jgi:hypothetical protein